MHKVEIAVTRSLRELQRDPYGIIGVATLLVLAGIAALESFVKNSPRLSPPNWQESPTDFLPPSINWHLTSSLWSSVIFAYGVWLAATATVTTALLLFHWRYAAAIERERMATESATSAIQRELGDPTRKLSLLSQRADGIIKPMLGGIFITTIAWLTSVILAAKIDPEWSRPFLPPPLLVLRNLEQLAPKFAPALARSSWHMLQAIVLGTLAGVLLGFLLSNLKWLQRWTVWHLAVISALPPFTLAEVFRQAVRPSWFPVFGAGEIAFKLGIAMASWAVMWPVLTATAHALSRIDDDYRRSVRLLGARSIAERLWHIELPFVIPPVLANLRVGFVIGLIVLTYGESYGSPPGSCLGFWFSELTNNYKLPSLAALVFAMSILVIIFEAAISGIERFFVFTRPRAARAVSSLALHRSVAEQRRNCLEQFEDARRSAGIAMWTSAERLAEPFFRLRNIQKAYGNRPAFAVRGAEQKVKNGIFVSVIGRSGAGKSTLLKLLLGFEVPEAGHNALLEIGGIDLLHASEADRRSLADIVAYVAQKPSLLPHRTVEQNILFGLRQQWKHLKSIANRDVAGTYEVYMRWLLQPVERWRGNSSEPPATPFTWHWPADPPPRRAFRRRLGSTAYSVGSTGDSVDSPLGLLIRFLGLGDKMFNYPAELSGGEAQRVHLLRWLALGRPILMMDEAFSALDQPLKGMVRDAIRAHTSALGISALNVSHDRADVLQISDIIIFVDDAGIRANDSPQTVFFAPPTGDLAIFLGHTNLFHIRRDAGDPPDVIRIARDDYREVAFAVESLPTLRLRRNTLGSKDDRVFIPRSFVNMREVTMVESADADWFRIESMRFTGTHFDVQLMRRGSDGKPFRLDCVIQDDEFADLAEKAQCDPTLVQHGFARVEIVEAISLKVPIPI